MGKGLDAYGGSRGWWYLKILWGIISIFALGYPHTHRSPLRSPASARVLLSLPIALEESNAVRYQDFGRYDILHTISQKYRYYR